VENVLRIGLTQQQRERTAVEAAPARVKPRLRGVFHEAGFYLAAVLAVPLVATAAPGSPRAGAIVFAASLVCCFGASALYHRPTWQPATRSWLATLDQTGVYLLIAGTYTPVCLLVLSSGWRNVLLVIVWSGACGAILLRLIWARRPKWLGAVIGLALGWVAAVAFSQLLKIATPGLVLLVAGGVFYSVGAIVYARRRPDPAPQVFGYHELFHVLTLAAAGCHYVAIAFYVLPRA
jgi:hemolysin III